MSKVIAVYADLGPESAGIGPLRTMVADAMTGDILHTIDHEMATPYAGVIMGIIWAWLETDADVIYTNNTAVYSAFIRSTRGGAWFTFHDRLDLKTRFNLAWCEAKVNELGFIPPVELWLKKEMNNTDIRAAWKYLQDDTSKKNFVDEFELIPCSYIE